MTQVMQAHTNTGMSTSDPATHEAETFQLTRLSSVINGLENGALAMRHHAQEALNAVRAGTYSVDPKQLSQRIVGEALGAA